MDGRDAMSKISLVKSKKISLAFKPFSLTKYLLCRNETQDLKETSLDLNLTIEKSNTI